MFDPSAMPRLFGLAPGVDFPTQLVAGLRHRLKDQPPHAMAQVDLIVNTRRMARRLRDIFDAGPPGFLPRIRLLTELDDLAPEIAPDPATSPLRRRLELIQLVSRLLETQNGLAPRTSLYALSDSLAALIDEMQGEGVTADDIKQLDVSDKSGHWARTQLFIGIAHDYLDQMDSQPDSEARQRQLVERLVTHWDQTPTQNPVIVAGSTGSRGTTAMLMRAVAKLPQGALVLPGFDFTMTPEDWAIMRRREQQPPEDHPQFRFFQLMRDLDVPSITVGTWTAANPPSAARNALVSLSLCPAPVTDNWLRKGPMLTDLDQATADLSLIEAPTPRIEALAIALRLRKALEDGQTAALITPDRMLTRQVTSALDRWNILPDDSAGTPLQLSPPGRFLRHVARLFVNRMDAEALLTLLKHPLTHSGADRNFHQLSTQRLEARIREKGLPYPDAAGLERIGAQIANTPESADWLNWVAQTFGTLVPADPRPLTDWVQDHQALAEKIAAGTPKDPDHRLWKLKAGRKALEVMETLAEHAHHGGTMTASDYADLVGSLLAGEEVRDRDAPHPDVMIWGTLEARVQGADLVILGSLNDGSWPEAPAPDPWLNRQMRLDAGLLLPERRIGLSAHDYQQAIAAGEVVLTRSIRSDEAETVPSRWLNRLQNLLEGLPDKAGKHLLERMGERGAHWLGQAQALEQVHRAKPAIRPSPRPPVSVRPRQLAVTEIKRLIRDPYAIYARHVLGLRAIQPLVQSPDAPLRGTLVHAILERFVKSALADPATLTRDALMSITDEVLMDQAPWPSARIMWRARIERFADWFIEQERHRQATATPTLMEREARGALTMSNPDFTLICYADRIDMDDEGQALIYDYKTGKPPTKQVQKHFDKQLLLEAAMIEEGAFAAIGPTPVKEAVFIGLGTDREEVKAPLADEPPQEVLAGFRKLISGYLDAQKGFTARRLVQVERDVGDYDQLARFGEWDGSTPATPEDIA